jgi:hypothetical protein
MPIQVVDSPSPEVDAWFARLAAELAVALEQIGADEFIAGVECKHIYLPLVLRGY